MVGVRGDSFDTAKTYTISKVNKWIYRVFLNHWSIIDLYCGRNFDHIVSRFFAMCSHGSGYFSDMSHMIIGQIYFFVERKT